MTLPPALVKILGSLKGDGSLIKEVGEAIDKNVTSKNELEMEALKIQSEQMQREFELDKEELVGTTERHKNDMMSDNWLSKSVRPLMAFASIVITIILTVLDSINTIEFDVPGAWIDLWVYVLGAVIGFYFVGRSAEKLVKMISAKRAPDKKL